MDRQYFHVQPNVAPLKPWLQSFTPHDCLNFHVQPNVAPLKLDASAGLDRNPVALPRSAERGPIEACYADRYGSVIASTLPRSAERGPIEALRRI